jgi:hypothetical protein
MQGPIFKRLDRVRSDGPNYERRPFLIFSPLLYQLSYLAGAEEGAAKEGRGLTSMGFHPRPLGSESADIEEGTGRRGDERTTDQGMVTKTTASIASSRTKCSDRDHAQITGDKTVQSNGPRLPNLRYSA